MAAGGQARETAGGQAATTGCTTATRPIVIEKIGQLFGGSSSRSRDDFTCSHGEDDEHLIVIRKRLMHSFNGFVDIVKRSGLLSSDELDSAINQFTSIVPSLDSEQSKIASFGHFLVENGKLTRWQCDKLQLGKWKGFFFDDYMLIDHVGTDVDSINYLAVDVRNGTHVTLNLRIDEKKQMVMKIV